MNRIKRFLKFLWGCICYSEGIKAYYNMALTGVISPEEYNEIEKRLREKYIEGEE